MKSQSWYPSNKLISLMNKYVQLQEKKEKANSPKIEHEMWILKTDILNLLFGY